MGHPRYLRARCAPWGQPMVLLQSLCSCASNKGRVIRNGTALTSGKPDRLMMGHWPSGVCRATQVCLMEWRDAEPDADS